MSLRPDHDAQALRALMERFNSAAEPVSPDEQADQIRQQLAESADQGVTEGSANANETLRSQIIKLYKKGLEDYDIAYDLDIDEKIVADIIDDYDKKQQQQYFKKKGVAEGNIAEDLIRQNLAAALKQLGFKGPFRLGQLPKWMAELQLDTFGEDTSIMIGGDDPEYDPWVAKGYDYGYTYGIETGYQTGLSAREVLNNAKSDIQNLKNVAEAESEKSEMDTPAVQGAIARMRQRHEKEPFDLKKAQALGQKLAARNRDPRRK